MQRHLLSQWPSSKRKGSNFLLNPEAIPFASSVKGWLGSSNPLAY
jgi:hypothetical protein